MTLKVIADIFVFPKILPVFSKALGLVICISKTPIIIYGFFDTSVSPIKIDPVLKFSASVIFLLPVSRNALHSP